MLVLGSNELLVKIFVRLDDVDGWRSVEMGDAVPVFTKLLRVKDGLGDITVTGSREDNCDGVVDAEMTLEL